MNISHIYFFDDYSNSKTYVFIKEQDNKQNVCTDHLKEYSQCTEQSSDISYINLFLKRLIMKKNPEILIIPKENMKMIPMCINDVVLFCRFNTIDKKINNFLDNIVEIIITNKTISSSYKYYHLVFLSKCFRNKYSDYIMDKLHEKKEKHNKMF